jgi:branched-chain amino acid transport system permease protein
MADALGINVERVCLIVFVLGAGMAGIAGAMIGPLRNVYPTLGVELLIPAFVVVIIGGLGGNADLIVEP